MHQHVQGLEKFNIPLDALPNESGGKAGPAKELFDEVIEIVESNYEYFIEDEKYKRVDESKRIVADKPGSWLPFWK